MVETYFGRNSEIYNHLISIIEAYYIKKQKTRIFQKTLLAWEKNIFSLYSKTENKFELFLNHIYLVVVIDLIVIKYIKSINIPIEILNEISLYNAIQIRGNQNLNFVLEFTKDPLYQEFQSYTNKLIHELYFDDKIEDYFSILYQNIIQKKDRHQTGEYYTPSWLIKNIIKESFDNYLVDDLINNKLISVCDPACGSGSFIIEYVSEALNRGLYDNYYELIENVSGFDINHISIFIARANYLLLIPQRFLDSILDKNSQKFNNQYIPISLFDTIKIRRMDLYLNDKILLKHDFLIGNPPWITLKSIGDINLQEIIKTEIFSYKLIEKFNSHLFTQMEVASLFFCKAADILLKKHGTIVFVMPKSCITGSIHNDNFRKFLKPKIKLISVWDLQEVKNVFGIPSCVLFGIKGERTMYPVSKIIFKGDAKLLVSGNAKLVKVISKYSPPNFNTKNSFYYDKFKVGASIFPRNLYFVQIEENYEKKYLVKTDTGIESKAKKEWKKISLRGSVSNNFLFSTLLAWELIPFGYTKLREIILPIKINNEKNISLINVEDIDASSKIWFKSTNKIWKDRSTQKSKIRFPNLKDRLNYNNLLIKQNLAKRYIVLYSGTGTNICSCVIDRENLGKNFLKVNNHFIADVKTWILETNVEYEAHYICAVLNSSVINKLIKPLQPQGLGGARAIHRRPFQFPIPKFDKEVQIHIELSNISIFVHKLILESNLNQGLKSRKIARIIAQKELKNIDKSVVSILKTIK